MQGARIGGNHSSYLEYECLKILSPPIAEYEFREIRYLYIIIFDRVASKLYFIGSKQSFVVVITHCYYFHDGQLNFVTAFVLIISG